MDEREKIINERANIIDIIERWHCTQSRDVNGHIIWLINDTERLADALLAANIGDVTAHEAEAEYWKTICKFEGDEYHTTIKNAAEHARHLMQERDEWKERAEKAESQLEEQKAVNLYRMDMADGKIDMTVGSEEFKDFFLAIAQVFEQNNAKRFLSTSVEITGEKYGITIQKVGEKTVADELNMLKSLYEHEKHRAETAEKNDRIKAKALKDAVREYRCEQCPDKECDVGIRSTQECVNHIVETYIKQNEREMEVE